MNPRSICCFALTSLLLTAVAASAGAVPLTGGNLLVSQDDVVKECTPAGGVVQAFMVPWGGGVRPATEWVRDIVADPLGRVHIYNGTFQPYMTTLDPAASTWASVNYPEWSTVNNVSYGGIAFFQGTVFVTDMSTFGGGSANGVVRFDLAAGTAMRFDNVDWTDLTLGLDELLYVSAGSFLHVYDPSTLALIRTIFLAADCRAIAVNAAGHVFGVGWDGVIYHFDPNGALLASLPSGTSNLVDIDINAAGKIVVGGRFGEVIQTDSSLAAVSTFVLNNSTAFVAFTTAGQACLDGATCDDGDPCTTGDTCMNKVCSGSPLICDSSDPCHGPGTCDPMTGLCSSPPTADGSACDDNDGCTTGDVCTSGVCGGAPVTCAAIDSCHEVGVCDGSTGLCTTPESPDGAPCPEGACHAGVCETGGTGGGGTGGTSAGGGDGGTATGATGGAPNGGSGAGGATAEGGTNSGDGGAGDKGGCGCHTAPSPESGSQALALCAGLLGIVLRRRRPSSRRNPS